MIIIKKKYLLVIIMVIIFTVYAYTKETTASPTAKERLAELENSGAIPKLDRTDSLAGIDANANGIRDDIEEYITKNYSNPEQRAAVMQFAAAEQSSIVVDKANNPAVRKISQRISRAINCIYTKFNDSSSKNPGAVAMEIEEISSNTKIRLQEHLAYSKALSGTVLSLPEGDTCE